jgi:pectinesterase
MKAYKKILIFILCTIFVSNSFGVTYNATVAKDGTGNYTTVQAAFNAAPSNSTTRWVIYIKNGTYKEMLSLASGKNNITIYGESKTGVILTYDNYSGKINSSTGVAYSTSTSASTYIYGTDFYAYNISFQNSAGAVGQALAIYVKGDRAVFNNCQFLGNQDTYYGHNARNYFYNCYFEGTTDFIFGSSIAWYESCQIYCKGGTSITAASTEPYVPFGYVFNKCTITGAGTATTDLGRPWQPYASVAYINSSLSGVIKLTGWNDWGNTANDATARFGEYNNTGAGSSMTSRPSWVKRITASEAASYTVLNVMKGTYASPQVIDNWNPQTVIDQTNGTAATLTKHGSGSSSQTITLGTALTSFYYTWANATGVTVTGLPAGVTATISSPNVTISGTPTVAGTFTYTITTTGGSPNVSVSGTITVNSSTTSTLIYQGENAVINTGVTETKNAGYTGTGYANPDNAIGTYVEFTVTTSTAGTFSIFFRYASVGDRPADIYVNGTKVISALAFPTTVAWTTWSTTAAQNVTLLNGVNTIRVTATTAGGPANLDYLQVTGSGTLKSADVNDFSVSLSDREIKLYPNPVTNSINISGNLKAKGNVTVRIYNQLGSLVDSKNFGIIEKGNFNVSIPASNINSGIYILKVQMNAEIITLPFVKK